MSFDTKIKIALRNNLKQWQELNVNSFLMSGIAGTQSIVGEPYVDSEGHEYLPMSQQPIMIHTGDQEQLSNLLSKSLDKDVVISIFTEELFKTYNDEDNRAVISKLNPNDMKLVGIGIRGKKNHVDKLFKNISLHQ